MYEPSKHMSTFHIAGFQRYDGALVLDRLKVGTQLDVVPEPENPYDPSALALRFDGTMLGYVPRDENGMLALLAYFGHADVFEARVLQVDPEAAPWNQVRVGIFMTDAR